MFNIKMEEGELFKKIFQTVNKLITETKIIFTQKGIYLDAIDEGKIVTVHLSLLKEDFEDYTIDGEWNLGINIDNFVKILNRINAKDTISLSYDPKTEKIKIVFKNPDSKDKRTFNLGLVELKDSGIKREALINLSGDNSLDIKCKNLIESQKDAIICSETLIFKMSEVEKSLSLTAVGILGDYETIKYEDGNIISDINIENDAENTYALEYLDNILAVNSITEEITLFMEINEPLRIKSTILNNSEIQYVMAPRIEED